MGIQVLSSFDMRRKQLVNGFFLSVNQFLESDTAPTSGPQDYNFTYFGMVYTSY
jgi:hypothetical protein